MCYHSLSGLYLDDDSFGGALDSGVIDRVVKRQLYTEISEPLVTKTRQTSNLRRSGAVC